MARRGWVRRSQRAAVVAAAIAIGACSSAHYMQQAMDSWRGTNIEQVIAAWGYPSKELTVSGRKLYMWTNKGCDRTFDVDAKNVVRGWEYRGGGCPVFKVDAQPYARRASPAYDELSQAATGPRYDRTPTSRARRVYVTK